MITKNIDFLDSSLFTYDLLLADFSNNDLRLSSPFPTNPVKVSYNKKILTKQVGKFEETATKDTSTEIKYLLYKNEVPYFFKPTFGWILSDGSYAQSNTALEINTNISSFNLGDKIELKIDIFLFTESSLFTPILSNIAITYDYEGEEPETIKTCLVWGYLKDSKNQPLSGKTVSIKLSKTFYQLYDSFISTPKIDLITDAEGYWEADLINTEDLGGGVGSGVYYTFTVDKNNFNKVIENTLEVSNFNDLDDYS